MTGLQSTRSTLVWDSTVAWMKIGFTDLWQVWLRCLKKTVEKFATSGNFTGTRLRPQDLVLAARQCSAATGTTAAAARTRHIRHFTWQVMIMLIIQWYGMDNRCSVNPAGARRCSELHTPKSRIGSTKDRSTQMGQPPSCICSAFNVVSVMSSET